MRTQVPDFSTVWRLLPRDYFRGCRGNVSGIGKKPLRVGCRREKALKENVVNYGIRSK